MFVEARIPEHLTGQELDAYLERGWFRIGQLIFTTNFAHVKDQMLSTIWLRVNLAEYTPDSTHTHLTKRNARFTTSIQRAELTEEKQSLFSRYRDSLAFNVSESLWQLLFGREITQSIYSTYEVTVHDGKKLIACGFFDLGAKSVAGIVSFYDPEYKKYSLGKYIVYQKIQYSRLLGFAYFYPGYFIPGNPRFDYKLMIARSALQFLQIRSASWQNISTFTEADIPAQKMETRLNELKRLLGESGIDSQVMKYEFFDAGLVPEMCDSGLLDFPLFLYLDKDINEPVNVLVVFDVRDDHYYLLVCTPVLKPDHTHSDATFYSAYFLKPIQEVYQSAETHAMAELLVRIHERKNHSI